MINRTPEERTQNILAMTRGILRELEDTQMPEEALEHCREIYRVAIQAFPGEELIRAIESRLPKPRTAAADDISMSTNNGKLIITRPIGELNGQILYATPTPRGVYFGAVKYARGTTAADLIPDWDIEHPEARRSHQGKIIGEITDKRLTVSACEKGDCQRCANRTAKADEAGKFRCKKVRYSAKGQYSDCADVPAYRCEFIEATPLTVRMRMTGERWHKAVVFAAKRGMALPEEYYPFIASVDTKKGPELAKEYAYYLAALAAAGTTVHEVLATDDPKATAAQIYPKQADAIKQCLASAAIKAVQKWAAEQNTREQDNAPIGINQEGQKACP